MDSRASDKNPFSGDVHLLSSGTRAAAGLPYEEGQSLSLGEKSAQRKAIQR